MVKQVSDWMRVLVVVYADGEWVEGDLLWRGRVGGWVGQFAVIGAGVQSHWGDALMLNGETDDEIYITLWLLSAQSVCVLSVCVGGDYFVYL